MNIRKFLYGLLGYSRSERTGSLVLVIVVSVVIILRLADINNKELPLSTPVCTGPEIAADDTSGRCEPFEFDPNNVSFDSLLKLGLTTKQANTLINYRQSGAVFYVAEDFRKVYGISKSRQDSLIPYIVINKIKAKAGEEKAGLGGSVFSDKEFETLAEERDRLFIPVELNAADSAIIVTVPGIGAVLGPRIIKYRNLLGGFYSIMQLSEVYGLDSGDIKAMLPYIIIDTTLIVKTDLNSAEYTDLLRHPYLTAENTRDIINYRKFSGSISGFKELLRNSILTKEEISKLAIYFYVCDSVNIER